PSILYADRSARLCLGMHVEQLYLPHAVASVAPALLQNGPTPFTKPGRETLRELFGGAIQLGVVAPADVPSAEQHLLGAELQDHRRIRGNPYALRRGFDKNGVQVPSVGAILNRIDPDQDTVEREQLVSNLR